MWELKSIGRGRAELTNQTGSVCRSVRVKVSETGQVVARIDEVPPGGSIVLVVPPLTTLSLAVLWDGDEWPDRVWLL